MKILFLTPWYPDTYRPHHGIFVQEQAMALSGGHEVKVIVGKFKPENFKQSDVSDKTAIENGVEVTRAYVPVTFPLLNYIIYYNQLTRISVREIEKFKPDLIVGNIGFPGAYWARRVSLKTNIPYVMIEHSKITHHFKRSLFKTLTLKGYENSKAVITVSKAMAEEISGFTHKKTYVAPNVVRCERFQIHPHAHAVPVIGFLGNLHSPIKGLDILLEALSQIHSPYRIHIGGGGAMLDTYKHDAAQLGIASKCKFEGMIGPENVAGFLSKIDFFVSASRIETFGVAIVEAMASGLPVITTDCAGPSSYMHDAVGMIVPKESVEELKSAIEKMMVVYTTYDRQAIRDFVLTKFSAEAFKNKFDSIIEEAQVFKA